jgi:hypothetical protein
MTKSATRILAVLAALLPLGAAACSDDAAQRSEANYCTQVGNHLADLNAPSLATGDDIERVVDAWRAVAQSAPLAIEEEWNTMVANIETASTVDPNDADSMQLVADSARSSEPAANRVIAYTQQRCGALIGSVAPTPTSPAPTATEVATTDT